ncbi:hypothetical protein [Butyrivibrio fibrisolvens]|uniref:hypothetical protein n=1 Tax=Butyrivibrio fibrisolvens TaxID=831 RepID=UPI00041763B9|nr:hypothetical protein [Butyrivibrio fibrisolvens]
MGIFQNGDDEDDELFDLFMLNEIHEESIKNRQGSSGSGRGGCLTSLILMLSIPVGIAFGIVYMLV